MIYVAGKDPEEELGGHSSYVRAHARAAARAGFEPHVFCVGHTTRVRETEFGVLHRLRSPFRPFRQIMVPGHGPILARGVSRFALAQGGDHLLHSFGLLWGSVGVAASRIVAGRGRSGVPIVNAYTTYRHECLGKIRGVQPAHGWRPRIRARVELAWIRTWLERYERRAYRHSRLVLVNYDSVRRLLVDQYGNGAECRRVPYTTETAFREGADSTTPERPRALRALRPAGAPLIVSVSRHDPRKGVDVLLRALADLQASGVEFRACLVGGGRLLETHRRLCGQLGLGERTAVVGWVPEVSPYLRHADVFVLPSVQEGSGSLALIEAFQAGAAVVASRLDGIPEDVEEGVDALLVEPQQVGGLGRALRRLVTDAALRHELARNGRRRFVERFSGDVLVATLGKTYAGLGFVP